MKYLIDTHILIWFLFEEEKLPKKAKEIIENENNEIYFSAINIWEIQIKQNMIPIFLNGKMSELVAEIIGNGFMPLPFYPRHVYTLDTLKIKNKKIKHNDPFDRALLAQAKKADMFFITHDHLMKNYDEDCILIV